jgi:dTDP-4-amino-4,6-dideoxygalactose transaminase
MPFLPFHRPTIYDHHVQAVTETLRSGWLTSGGKVAEFEKAFALKVGAKHAVAVSSCTAAIHLALVGLGVGPSNAVVTSPITFVSAVNVIEHAGAVPVFADVLQSDLTIDPESVREKIKTYNPKAVIVTHFAGFPAHMDELEAVCQGVPIITDAAHGIELSYRGRRSGQLGKAACYSFYATKNITTGEGGMLVTDDDALADRARILRLHGMTKDAWNRYGQGGYKHWDVEELGWKYNMSDIHAALGLSQLGDMDAWLGKRIMLWNTYANYLDREKVGLFQPPDTDIMWAHHLFVVRIPKRDQVMDEMQKRGIGVGVHFRAVHRLAYYRKRYLLPEGWLPEAEKASDEILSLPLYPSMETSDVYRVIKVLEEVIDELR